MSIAEQPEGPPPQTAAAAGDEAAAGRNSGVSLETLFTVAVRALTQAALATGPDGERGDFGAVLCHVVASVAANLGSVEALLAGRPGSWEADYVRRIVMSTVPLEELLSYRTEPLRLRLDPEEVFVHLDIQTLYEEAQDAVYSPLRGTEPPDIEAHLDACAELDQALEDLYKADLKAYVEAYTRVVRELAAARRVTVPVEVAWVEGVQDPEWDTLAWELHTVARQRTPLPTSGVAPDDYDYVVDGRRYALPGEVDRAAGRGYLERLRLRAGG